MMMPRSLCWLLAEIGSSLMRYWWCRSLGVVDARPEVTERREHLDSLNFSFQLVLQVDSTSRSDCNRMQSCGERIGLSQEFTRSFLIMDSANRFTLQLSSNPPNRLCPEISAVLLKKNILWHWESEFEVVCVVALYIASV